MLTRTTPKADDVTTEAEETTSIRRQGSSSGLLSLDDDGDAEIVIECEPLAVTRQTHCAFAPRRTLRSARQFI